MLNLTEYFALSSPTLIVFFTSVLVMMVDLFKPKSVFSTYLSYLGLTVALCLLMRLFPIQSFNAWGDLFVFDNVALIMQIFITISVALCIFYSSSKLSHLDSSQGDVLSLYLLSSVGMMLLVQSISFISLYLSLELTSLPLYALVASQRKNNQSVEAAVKFFILGALASVFILFGMSILYGITGQLALGEITKQLITPELQANSLLILLGLIFIIAGASFKMALVPFHTWLPDVYVGANPVMTLFLSAAPKIAGMGIFLRLSLSGLFDVLPVTHHVLALLALSSIAVGNFTAIVQKDLRRLLAYSTISHMGYALLGLIAGGLAGQFASLFYLITYSLMTIIAFAAVLVPNVQGDMLYNVDDLKGLSKRSPWMAAMLMIVFFSMAGVPPAIGFFSKFFVIKALVDTHYYSFAVIALILAVVGAFYYLNLIRIMYFEAPEKNLSKTLVVSAVTKSIFIGQALLLLVLGLLPNALITVCMQAIK
jgi:NADH-quinone oxidoreductase subunit N